jgi:hypothetical protein
MAFAFVKSAKGTSATTVTTPAFGSATTSGNLIVLAYTSDAYNAAPDTGWTQSTGMSQHTNCGGYIWWKLSTGETTEPSYSIGSATNSSWVLAEFSGNDATTPYDISNGQNQISSVSSYTTPSIIPTTGSRLLVAMIGGSRSTALTGATPYTSWLNSLTRIDDIFSTGTGTNDVVGIAYRAVTGDGVTGFSSGATTGGPTLMEAEVGLIIAFKASAAADVLMAQACL